jgi:hypothetical protein
VERLQEPHLGLHLQAAGLPARLLAVLAQGAAHCSVLLHRSAVFHSVVSRGVALVLHCLHARSLILQEGCAVRPTCMQGLYAPPSGPAVSTYVQQLPALSLVGGWHIAFLAHAVLFIYFMLVCGVRAFNLPAGWCVRWWDAQQICACMHVTSACMCHVCGTHVEM